MRLIDYHGRELNEDETNCKKEMKKCKFLGIVKDGIGRIPQKKQKIELRYNYLRAKFKYYI